MANYELKSLIDELKETLSRANEIIEKLSAFCPPEKKRLTLEEVREVLAEKSRNGKTEQVRELLKKHGADRLSAINPDNYQALLEDAEVL